MTRIAAAGLLAVVASCSSPSENGDGAAGEGDPAAEGAADPAGPGSAADPAGAVNAAEPAFGPEVRSLRLRRSIAVRLEPRGDAERLGTVARDTRVRWQRAVEGPDCRERWIEIAPRGWICEKYLEPTKRRPHGVELPKLAPGEIVPGTFGKVVAEEARIFVKDEEEGAMVEDREPSAHLMVRRYGEETVDDVTYWQVDPREPEFIPADQIREFRASEFRGTRLGDDTGLSLPLGFTMNRKHASRGVDAWSDPIGGTRVKRLRGREAFPVLETATNDEGKAIAHRVGEGLWVRARELRVAETRDPPGTLVEGERWFDLHLDEQVLVAYEGTTPVYATLASTGSRQHPTETGVYRIWIKFAEVDMSDLAGESPYSVATVPWTQYYAKDLALHTAYWHDTFGTRRSHGCTNLSPYDARFLYFWSQPDVPPGWSMSNGVIEEPGSLVRVWSNEEPDPEIKGYAVRVEEARRAALADVSDG